MKRLHPPCLPRKIEHMGALEPPRVLAELVAQADVRFNGDRPWDIQVHDPEVYSRILRQGSLGFGEAYMDGLWDCAALDALFYRLLATRIDKRLGGRVRWRLFGEILRHNLFNLQSRRRAFQVGEHHYDIGNDVFEAMLDGSMSYSCAYWAAAEELESAQRAKLELICRKLELRPGERLLDIGCGWGGLARHAAEHHGVEVVGITVSREQQRLARERCAGLPVRIELMDYRDVQGRFDKIVSVGMFEHVGPRNYGVYFDTVLRLLEPQGLFLLHTIGVERTGLHTDPWIDRYIFPNGRLPSPPQLARALDGRMVIEDWHSFGQDYDRTLMSWSVRFEQAWPQLASRYDRRFQRMWRYYLQSCAGFFRARRGQLWQLVLSHPGRRALYRSLR